MKINEVIARSEEDVAVEVAEMFNDKIFGWLGSGEWGEAYETENGLVIKITNSKREAYFAKKLKDLNLPNVVKIFRVFKYKGYYVIIQELLDTDRIDDLFGMAESTLEYLEMDWDDVDLDPEFLDERQKQILKETPEEVVKFIKDLSNGINQVTYYLGINALDLQSDNIGKSPSSGDYVLFDVNDLSRLH